MLLYVFSDSHGATENMVSVLSRELPDMVIHLGDHVEDAEYISRRFPMRMLYVAGNSYDDSYSGEPLERIVTLEGHRIYFCHGHRHHVKTTRLNLVYAAREQEAEIALFGHTHVPCDETADGVRLINPGSISKGWLGGNSYAAITLTHDNVTCEIRKIPKP